MSGRWHIVRKVAPIVALAVLSVVAALAARDAAAVHRSIEQGDLVFAQGEPVYDRLWAADTTVPYLADLFEIDDDLLYRHALRKYAAEDRRQRGRLNSFNPGLRAEAQAALSYAERSGGLSPARRAQLASLQSVMSYDETLTNPIDAGALAQQALEHAHRAVKTDPSNIDAKYNLEYLLRLVDPNQNNARQRQFVPADIEARSLPGSSGARRGHGY